MSASATAQQVGSIRGVVYDKDFDAPLAGANVSILGTDLKTVTAEGGTFTFAQVAPGQYTLVFSKDGYTQEVIPNIVVTAGQLTDVDASLVGEYTEMDEFIVQDLQIGGEAGLLKIRLESPAVMDSISSDWMSKAGASDAASALRLVTGATVQDGKFAVVRGLPDRYVNSQLNGVRLPTADEDKRAVELDQFPTAVIDSIQVTKTFTPDQQGDASGGAVNVVLKGLPVETMLELKEQVGYNTQVTGQDFLTYQGGGLDYWGNCKGDREPQPVGTDWTGAAGVSDKQAPPNSKWSVSGGGTHEFDDGMKLGGFASFFHEEQYDGFDNGIDNSYWVENPGDPLTPQTYQGTFSSGDFKTGLYDVTQGTQTVQWAGLGVVGLETEDHLLGGTYLYTKTSQDQATLAEDTRGKAYFFPGYDPTNPMGVGNEPENRLAAPYLRTETLECTERTTQTLMFNGRHTFTIDDLGGDEFFFQSPELDWVFADSSADLNQPDKRQFGSMWLAPSFNPGFPPFVPPFIAPGEFLPFKPAANFNLGNLQRIWKTIDETSTQYALNLKLPFQQWSGDAGYLKFGYFDDSLERTFDQDTFSNFGDNSTFFADDFKKLWSSVFPSQTHIISDGPPFVDVDYDGQQDISAFYAMMDLPLTSQVNLVGGARFESTELSIVNFPEQDARWFPEGASAPVALLPGDADVDFSQNDVLPAIALLYEPVDDVIFRAAFGQTVARQTFKELTPIIQQEYLGGPIFIGNPDLQMSNLDNYDLRVDYTPYEGGLWSASWFYKDVQSPIEYVQRVAGFTFTTPVNYPDGWINGFEFEVRHDMGHFWENLTGLSVGANATLINSQVTLPEDEAAGFDAPDILAPMSTRPMTGAPDYLYNLYLVYDSEPTGTQIGLFYTVTGDTLIAGAGQADGNFVPNTFELAYGTLNLTVTQNLTKWLKFQFQAKNLTNPAIETVYRSEYTGGDLLHTSYTKGIELTVGLNASFVF